jgi:hypothetical protein
MILPNPIIDVCITLRNGTQIKMCVDTFGSGQIWQDLEDRKSSDEFFFCKSIRSENNCMVRRSEVVSITQSVRHADMNYYMMQLEDMKKVSK